MSYDYDYDAPPRDRGSSRRQYRDDRRDDRYADEGYLSPRGQTSSRDLVPRHREDSDLSVEEVPRNFPPPGYGRARSADPGYYDDYDDRRSQYSGRGDHDRGGHHHHRSQKKGGTSLYYEEEERKRARVLGKQEKLIAALVGGALAVGGKELFDRREAHQEGGDIHRNPLTSVALGAAGALAGYQGAEFYNKRASKEEKKSTYMLHHSSDGRVAEAYYSDDEETGSKEKKGHKNFLESAVAAAGLGTAFKALTGGHDDKHSDTSSRRGSRSGGKDGGGGAHKIQQAAMASLIAGATEAFRVAKEPGGWKGEKAKRILTVAAGAASVDAVSGDKHPKLALAESVIAGLGLNRALNGSRKNIEEDKATGRSRSRSRARSSSKGGGGGGGATGLAALATAGLGALGAKKLMDNSRDRSRSRQRSVDSDRSGSPDGRRRSRSRSVVDTGRRALAKLGIGSDPDGDRRRDDDGGSSRGGGGRSRGHGSDDGYDDRRRGGGGRDDYDDDARSHNGGGGRSRNRSRSGSRQRGGQSGSESDLGDSDEDNKRAKKMRGKQILTTGLAAVATIHAAHNVYQSMEKRNARHKAVKEGRLSEEEAKKLKTKALLQDAASVGIAALGIKGALSELKEAREMSHECKEWQEEKEKRHAKRLQRQKGGGHHKALEDRDRSHDHDDGGGYGDHDGYDDRYYDGPRYPDGNPYAAALPAPPVGYYDDRR